MLLGLLGALLLHGRAQSFNPDDVLRVLNSSLSEEPPAFARLFALTIDTHGPNGNGSVDRPCAGFEHSSRKTLWDDSTGEVNAIETHSVTCRRGFLILFARNNQVWAYAGTVLLEEHYGGTPEYRVVPSLVQGMPAIVVKHNLVDWGTGIEQWNMQVYLLIGNFLRPVFDEPECITLGIPFKPDGHVEKQVSVFRIVQGSHSDPDASIEETRHSTVNGKSVTQYRSYAWDRHDQKYRGYSSGPR
jgi:hypothetical protein